MAAAQQPVVPAPPPGVHPEAKLFNGWWYRVYFEQMDWRRSKRECERLGGQLAIIPDEQTWNFVKTLTKQRVWLGATDEDQEGEWKWIDGTPLSFTAWDDGEPNNVNKKEHYLCRSPFGGWADTVEKWDGYSQWAVSGYICQWKAPDTKASAQPANAAKPALIEVATWDAASSILTMKSQDRLRSFRVMPETTITLNGLKSLPNSLSPGLKVMSFTLIKDNTEALGSIALEGITSAATPSPATPIAK